jgi:Tfp pilus assembly protein PilZ
MQKASLPAAHLGDPPETVLARIRIPLMQLGTMVVEGASEEVFVLDLGVLGVFVERERPLPVGARVEIRFRLPGNEIPVAALCRVAWWHPAGAPLVSRSLPAGMGLNFLEISDPDRARIRERLLEHFRREPRARRFVRQWPPQEGEGEKR